MAETAETKRPLRFLTILCLAGTAAGAGAGIAFRVSAQDAWDAYRSAVDSAEIDRHYADYESGLSRSRGAFIAAGAFAAAAAVTYFWPVRNRPEPEDSTETPPPAPEGSLYVRPLPSPRLGYSFRW